MISSEERPFRAMSVSPFESLEIAGFETYHWNRIEGAGHAADPVLAADVRRRAPRFLLTQDADDLLFREPALTHRPSPSWSYGLYPNLEEIEGLRSTAISISVEQLLWASARHRITFLKA